ncbi:hypothetical protein CH380_15925 [Leptospira adleri]|uniref:Uncharacterized protein n=1 Tax=Leptospira adleri TaxID=2023186 RepID=A0A2M9YKT5_9LEPT|nr:hypothetical protein CH380_15925 [Leptospira adleri]PJZ63255.1 hypothetical protein CH376_04315 [Leptospira adleri]
MESKDGRFFNESRSGMSAKRCKKESSPPFATRIDRISKKGEPETQKSVLPLHGVLNEKIRDVGQYLRIL